MSKCLSYPATVGSREHAARELTEGKRDMPESDSMSGVQPRGLTRRFTLGGSAGRETVPRSSGAAVRGGEERRWRVAGQWRDMEREGGGCQGTWWVLHGGTTSGDLEMDEMGRTCVRQI